MPSCTRPLPSIPNTPVFGQTPPTSISSWANRSSNSLSTEDALDAYERGAEFATRLIDADVEPLKHRFYLARINLARAATFAVTGSLVEAEEILRAAKPELAELRSEVTNDQWYWSEIGVTQLRADYWLARIHGHRESLDAAQELCTNSLRRCRGQRTYHADDVRFLGLEIALVELSAELAVSRDDLTSAMEQYQTALEMRRATLHAGFAPERFIMEAAFKKSTSLDGQIEPGPFCGYVETQLKLADVLRRVDRPYAAEAMLGEAASAMAIVVAEYPNALRYRIADANIWALAAELLADRRPAEAQTLYRRARQVWTQAIEEFPHAREYVSGVHGLKADWTAYRDIEQLFPNVPATEDEETPVSYRDTVFHARSTGRSWASVALWDDAIRDFEHSAALEPDDPQYDWLQLAIAHAHLGKHREAEGWLDMAAPLIEQMPNPHRELIELRDVAQSTLAEHETKENPADEHTVPSQ